MIRRRRRRLTRQSRVPSQAQPGPGRSDRQTDTAQHNSVTSSDHFDTSAAAHSVHVKESPRHDIVIDVTTDPREDWAQAQARAAICVQPVDAHVCPAIRKPTRISLRSSSTHDPSDPPPRVVLTLTDLHAAAAEMTVQVVLFYRHCGIYRQIPVAMVRLRRAFTRERESLNRLTTVARQWLSRPVDESASIHSVGQVPDCVNIYRP